MSCWIDRSSRTLEQPAVSIRTLWRAHSFPPGRTPTRKHTLQDTPEKQIQTWCSRACMEHTRLPNFFFFSPPLIFKSITHYSSSWRSGVAGPGIHHSSAHARVFSPASRTGASIGTERRDALPRITEDIYFKFSSRLPKLFFFFFKKIPETVCQDESWGNMCKVMRRTNISPSPFNHTESRVLKTWLAERVTLSYMERFKGETQQLKILDLLDVGGLTSRPASAM